MSEQMKAAAIRAGLLTIVAALTAAQTYLLGTMTVNESIASFVAALVVILGRLGEGIYDTQRANTGDIRAGDVGVHN